MKLFSDYQKKLSVLQSERQTLEKQKLDINCFATFLFMLFFSRGEARRAA